MARKPRPIDPNEGPLQAFAYDLRGVREDAGNPTYRVLAGRAGFGATTLSDAAGGVRQPSLEVTLAYVGACGGDVELWERRWHELDRRLAEERVDDAAPEAADGTSTGPAGAQGADPADAHAGGPSGGLSGLPAHEDADAPAPDGAQDTADAPEAVPEAAAESAPESTTESATEPLAESAADRAAVRVAAEAGPQELSADAAELSSSPEGEPDGPETSRSRRWPVLATAVGLAVVAALLAVLIPKLSGGSAASAAPSPTPTPSATVVPPCADYGGAGAFSGTTYLPTTRVRAGAGTHSATLTQYPPGCQVEFSGFCLGEVITDAFSNTPDMRWFKVRGGGVISSGVIHGNPPKTMHSESCDGGAPPPSAISLTVSGPADGMDTIYLKATGEHLGIVGYAGFFATGAPQAPAPSWQQLGFTDNALAAFAEPWRLEPLRAELATRPQLQVVAVACMGGEGPTGIVDAELVRPGDPGAPEPLQLDADQLAAAQAAACSFPKTS
ncbi:hypothetical protein [Kitasatospora sp. NPDC094015]|uniref:hypothetical protein n=1 Tax=Kitasatospora sp. NPDC094015 TaxID=3155205 RepID=UPI00332AF84F